MKSFKGFLIEEQGRGTLTASGKTGVKGLNKSHIDLDKDDDLHKFKKTLGHKD